MNHEARSDSIQGDSSHYVVRRSRNYLLLGWILVPAALLFGVFVLLLREGSNVGDSTQPIREREQENHLAEVRSTLARQTDLPTCRVIVQQLNAHLQQDEERQPARLSEDDVKKLAEQLHLKPDDVAELTQQTFTTLDAHYLAGCFLLRDAARSLEILPVKAEGKEARQTSLDRAKAAFAWVVRQVRLMPLEQQALFDLPAPPAQVLRRGTGSPLERALVFLALIEQFGLDDDETVGPQGCLIFLPDQRGREQLWACGVAAGEEGLYLFDPRMGLPLPGPDAKGIATLEQAVSDPTVLGQLKIDNVTYDVTAEQAKSARLRVVCPLSAAAPRIRFLQERLLRDRSWREQPLPQMVRVRLAEDPNQALAGIQKASGKTDDVTFWPAGATLLRQFLPKDEGGSDTGVSLEIRKLRGFTVENDPRIASVPRERLYQLAAVPWEDYPPIFRDPETFRFDLGLGQRLRGIYGAPFLQSINEPKSPRDLLLRGKFSLAVRELVTEPPMLLNARSRLQQAENLGPELNQWVSQATGSLADLLRSKGTPDEAQANKKWESLWRWRGDEAIAVVMAGAVAGPRAAEVMYQLALCRHEQANWYQSRIEIAARIGVALPADVRNAAKTWSDAEGYWKEFLDANVGRAGFSEARRHRAEAQALLEQYDEARKSLLDLTGQMTELEKLACLWLAKQFPK